MTFGKPCSTENLPYESKKNIWRYEKRLLDRNSQTKQEENKVSHHYPFWPRFYSLLTVYAQTHQQTRLSLLRSSVNTPPAWAKLLFHWPRRLSPSGRRILKISRRKVRKGNAKGKKPILTIPFNRADPPIRITIIISIVLLKYKIDRIFLNDQRIHFLIFCKMTND